MTMVRSARDAGLRVYAANAPRRYVRLARTRGPGFFDGLTEEQRTLVEAPGELTGGAYRERFFGAMSHASASGHGGGASVEDLYFAQNVWDETMAQTVARALDKGHRPVVLVVGQFHSDFGGGLIERIARLAPRATVYRVSYEPVVSAQLREEDAGRADAVVYSGEVEN
jgi:uncharacterized iron-regulated protein